MIEVQYGSLSETEVITEKPTARLRWNSGILEQEWEREVHSPRRSIGFYWRPVPVFDAADLQP